MDNAEILKALSAEFPDQSVRERAGHGGVKLRWVPGRTISERLDSVLGITGWDFDVAPIANNCVIGTLTVRLPDGSVAVRKDFGYETGGSGESYKEAASDALRRCASLIGVARYLYQGDEPMTMNGLAREARKMFGTGEVTRVTKNREMLRAGSDPVPSNTAMTPEQAMVAAMSFVDGQCPDHGVPWALKPAGTSKTGKAYDPFWSCGAKDGNGWCRNRPSLKWLATNPAKAVAEKIEKQKDDLEDLEMAPTANNANLEELPF